VGANEEEVEEEAPETRIEVEIPKINTDLGRQLHFVKLPNFLSVETRFVGNLVSIENCHLSDIYICQGYTIFTFVCLCICL